MLSLLVAGLVGGTGLVTAMAALRSSTNVKRSLDVQAAVAESDQAQASEAWGESTESELATLIGTQDGHAIASRFLKLLESGELDPANVQEVDRVVDRITDEVVAESAKKYGPDTVFVEGDPYVFAAREALRESLSRGVRGLFFRNQNRPRIFKRQRVPVGHS